MCNNNTNQITDISTLRRFIRKLRNFTHIVIRQYAEQWSNHDTIWFRFRPDTLANIRLHAVSAGFYMSLQIEGAQVIIIYCRPVITYFPELLRSTRCTETFVLNLTFQFSSSFS